MNNVTFWWIAAGVIVGCELLTGTFYLLMLALGAAAAAVCAYFDASLTVQIMTCGIVGGASVTWWHLKRQKQKDRAQDEGRASHDLHLDIGQAVEVDQWSSDGRARIQYRGTQWDARLHGAHPAQPGSHRIRAVEGNCLVLEKN